MRLPITIALLLIMSISANGDSIDDYKAKREGKDSQEVATSRMQEAIADLQVKLKDAISRVDAADAKLRRLTGDNINLVAENARLSALLGQSKKPDANPEQVKEIRLAHIAIMGDTLCDKSVRLKNVTFVRPTNSHVSNLWGVRSADADSSPPRYAKAMVYGGAEDMRLRAEAKRVAEEDANKTRPAVPAALASRTNADQWVGMEVTDGTLQFPYIFADKKQFGARPKVTSHNSRPRRIVGCHLCRRPPRNPS